jgi:hypothetical protein
MRFSLIVFFLASTAMKAAARPRRPTPEDIMEALAKRQATAADGEQIDAQLPSCLAWKIRMKTTPA